MPTSKDIYLADIDIKLGTKINKKNWLNLFISIAAYSRYKSKTWYYYFLQSAERSNQPIVRTSFNKLF